MKMLQAALLAASLVVPSLAVTVPAMARSSVTVDFGNVSIGYRDGYYDRDHHYHRWARHDATAYRAQYQQSYRDMNHDRDRNRSWEH
jgi:hypothetical protein